MGYLSTRVWIILIYDGEFFSLHCGMIKLSIICPPAADAIVIDSVWKKGLWFHTTCLRPPGLESSVLEHSTYTAQHQNY